MVRRSLVAFVVLLGVALFAEGRPQKVDADYAGRILAQRKARDEEFRSRKWSPLAVVAIAPLTQPRTTIGSADGANLKLDSKDVRPIHAEILRQENNGRAVFRLRSVDGPITTDAEKAEPVRDVVFAMGMRVRIGRFIVYCDQLGTFGPVVRALDFTTPAYLQFDGLRYFAPDPAYRVDASVSPYPALEKTLITDTHGWTRPAWKYGEASFVLANRKLKLVLLLFVPEPKPGDSFFIAFSDETRGKETYPAARYIEVPFVRSGAMTIDFNLATNPSCAYNAGFACPLPPPGNTLPVEIRAGEKVYAHSVHNQDAQKR